MKNKTLFVVLGFMLFMTGFLSVVLMLIGVQFAFLTWIDATGKLAGFVIRLLMVLGGIVMVFLARTDWEREMQESAPDDSNS